MVMLFGIGDCVIYFLFGFVVLWLVLMSMVVGVK